MFNRRLQIIATDDGSALILPPDLLTYLKADVGGSLHATFIPHEIDLSANAANPHERLASMGNVDDETRD